jgi:hypothetical protein
MYEKRTHLYDIEGMRCGLLSSLLLSAMCGFPTKMKWDSKSKKGVVYGRLAI